MHDVWDYNLKNLKTWNDLLAGAWNSLEVPSITSLAIDAGRLLGPQVNCQAGHRHTASPCGFATWANLGSFIAWMLGSETKCSKRTVEEQSMRCPFLEYSIHCDGSGNQKVLLEFKWRDIDTTTQWEKGQGPTGIKH